MEIDITPIPHNDSQERFQKARLWAAGLLGASAIVGGGVVAMEYAPATHIEVAGQDTAIKPIIGQDTSRFDGAVIRPEHATIPGINKPVGVNVSVDLNKINTDDKNTRAALNQLWGNLDPEVARVKAAAAENMLHWGMIGSGGVLSAELIGAGWGLWHRRRLKNLPTNQAEAIRRFNAPERRALILGGVMLATTIDALALHGYLHADHHQVVGSQSLVGTPLEGTEVTGMAGKILPLLSAVEPNNHINDTASSNLRLALARRPELQPGDHETVFVVADDLEDANGMAQTVGETADDINAQFIAYTGDLTFGGKPIESYLIDTLTYYGHGTPIYFAPGPHDTDYIVTTAADRGWQIGDSKTHDVAGLKVLLMPDPRISTVGDFGTGDVPRSEGVTTEQAVATTIAEACKTQPNFIFLHDYRLGSTIAKANCQTTAVIDGRSYSYIGPRSVTADTQTYTVEYTNGSAGGHVNTLPNLGPIQNPATFSIFKYNQTTGQTAYSVVTEQPDGSIKISPLISLDIPYKTYLETGQTTTASQEDLLSQQPKLTQSRRQALDRHHKALQTDQE